jgi:hypothetical protein
MRVPLRFPRYALIGLISLLTLTTFLMTPAIAQSGLVELVPAGPTGPPVVPGPSPWGAGVRAAAALLGWLSDQALKSSINSKISDLKPEVNKQMPASGGVLIVIGIQQWKQPDNNGNYNRSVLDGYVAGTGSTPKAAMDQFLSHDRMETGPADGFVRRNIYFWKAASRQQ